MPTPAGADPRVDALRARMVVRENADFTRDYLDPAKRSIGNAVQVFFGDGQATPRVVVEYPLGHRRRRREGVSRLLEKFGKNLRASIPAGGSDAIMALFHDPVRLHAMPVRDFMDLFVI